MRSKGETRLIVGVDGRDESRDALALAFLLAPLLEAEVEAAAVIAYNPLPIDVEPYEQALEAHFDEIFAAVGREAAGHGFREHRITGSSPAARLAELAEELDANAIVIGSTHRGRLGRVFPGTVGDGLLSGAPCAVAVAPRGLAAERSQPLRRIGVGYDGGAEAELALAQGVRLAERSGATLELIAVAPFITPIPTELADPGAYEDALRRSLGDVARAAAGAIESVEVSVDVIDGDPARELCERSEDLDLLVLGSRGYGPLLRTFLGGTANRVIREARCPVLVLPRGAGQEPEPSAP